MSQWFPIDPAEFNRSEKTTENGVEIVMGMSPFDVPERVSGDYEPQRKRFVIRFEYDDDLSEDEPKVHVDPKDEVSLLVGENSGCLYEILVDVDRLKVASIRLISPAFRDAIDELTQKPRSHRKFPVLERQYRAAENLIREHADEYFGSTPVCAGGA